MLDPDAIRSCGPRQGEWSSSTGPGASGPRDFRLLWGAVPLGSLLASLSIRLTGLAGAMWIGALGTVLCLPPLLRRGVLASLTTPTGPRRKKRATKGVHR